MITGPTSKPKPSALNAGRTAYGFSPSPPEVSVASINHLYECTSTHGDFVLIQQNTAWDDFVNRVEGKSETRTDLSNQVKRARQNNLEDIFVIDALTDLNHRDFIGRPAGWEASWSIYLTTPGHSIPKGMLMMIQVIFI